MADLSSFWRVAASRMSPLRWAALGLSVVGLGIATYLTVVHYTAPLSLACPANSTINCEQVTTSAQSSFLGVPVALAGALYFLVLVAACLPWAWAQRSPWVHRGRLALAGLGVLFVLWLISAELFIINAICLWCTAIHAIAIALFGVIVAASGEWLWPEPPPPPPLRRAAGTPRPTAAPRSGAAAGTPRSGTPRTSATGTPRTSATGTPRSGTPGSDTTRSGTPRPGSPRTKSR